MTTAEEVGSMNAVYTTLFTRLGANSEYVVDYQKEFTDPGVKC